MFVAKLILFPAEDMQQNNSNTVQFQFWGWKLPSWDASIYLLPTPKWLYLAEDSQIFEASPHVLPESEARQNERYSIQIISKWYIIPFTYLTYLSTWILQGCKICAAFLKPPKSYFVTKKNRPPETEIRKFLEGVMVFCYLNISVCKYCLVPAKTL